MHLKKITAFLLSLTLVSATCINGEIISPDAASDSMETNSFLAEIRQDYNVKDTEGNSPFSICQMSIKENVDTLVIPSEYEGKNIGAFEGLSEYDSSINYFVFPEKMMMMNQDSLIKFKSLKCVVLPDDITEADEPGISSDVTVIGDKNGYAYSCARSGGNPFIQTGDMNGDGEVKVSDLVGAISYVIGQNDADQISKLAVDYDRDGKLGISDIIELKRDLLEDCDEDEVIIAGCITAPELYGLKREDLDRSISSLSSFAADVTDEVLLNTIDENGEVNTVYSPLSLYMAMSVLAECTDSSSLKQILSALHAENKEELRAANSALFKSQYFDDFSRYSRITNSVWLDNQYSYKEDTIKRLADYYYTMAFHRDLQAKKSLDDIAEWIYQNTAGGLRPEMKPVEDEAIKIVNTFTFKEKWLTDFENSQKSEFTLADGSTTECDMMFIKDDESYITRDEKYTRFTKLFKDGYRMNFVLPSEDVTVAELLTDTETMKNLFDSTNTGEHYSTMAYIPKFDISSSYSLIEAVRKLGVTEVFEGGDFTPVFGENTNNNRFSVAAINQEAGIGIDEKGCDAAVYTAISVKSESTVSYPSAVFRADRPFFYYVSDKENTPLFAGVLNNPNER